MYSMCGKHLLCVLRQTEAQVDDRQACKLLPQVKHFRVFIVIQVHTNRDSLAVSLIRCQS